MKEVKERDGNTLLLGDPSEVETCKDRERRKRNK
jgi:hypothetical protein